MLTLLIRDETATGSSLNEFTLQFPDEVISVRELIRSRVYQEVKEYNAKRPDVFTGLVQPNDAQRTRDGFKLQTGKLIDWQEQFEKAVSAFQGNGVIILVDDRQVEELDEEITLKANTQVSFLKLVPLVGG